MARIAELSGQTRVDAYAGPAADGPREGPASTSP